MECRILTCVYCGHEYPQDTPAHGDKVLTDHIAGCEKHPMRAVIEQRDFLLSALGRVQEMTKDSHPVAYGIAEHAIEYTRRDSDYKV